MSFPYTVGVPNPPNDPSEDVSAMQTNTNSINSWADIDHIGFNNALGGQHLKVTLPANATVVTPSGLGSVISSTPGLANAAASELIYTLPSIVYPLSAIKAFGTFPGNGSGTVVPSNSYNVASINTVAANWTSTITLPTGAVTGTSYLVISSSSFGTTGQDQIIINYNIVSATQFQLRTVNVAVNAVVPVTSISFIVLQF
jgi:hypothetical protein